MIPSISRLEPGSIKDIISGVKSLSDVLETTVGAVPMSQAVNGIDIEWEEPLVRCYNGRRAIKAQCNPAPGFTADDLRAKILPEI